MLIKELKKRLESEIGSCGLLDHQKAKFLSVIKETLIDEEDELEKFTEDDIIKMVSEIVSEFLRRNTGLIGGVENLSHEEQTDLVRITKIIWEAGSGETN